MVNYGPKTIMILPILNHPIRVRIEFNELESLMKHLKTSFSRLGDGI